MGALAEAGEDEALAKAHPRFLPNNQPCACERRGNPASADGAGWHSILSKLATPTATH